MIERRGKSRVSGFPYFQMAKMSSNSNSLDPAEQAKEYLDDHQIFLLFQVGV